MKKIKRHKSCNSIKLTKNPSPRKQRHTLTARACPLLSGVSREPLACCVSWGQKDDMMKCATARDRAGGPEATSCFSNHPAAWLNLQSCSVVRLKEAAWRANLEVAWCDLIFFAWMVEGRIQKVGRLIGFPQRSVGLMTTEAHGSEASVIKGGRGRAVCMMGTKLPGSSNKVCT